MGHEIVYCFKCQKRILGTDYTKGLAFQLENNSCCAGCAVRVLDTLPPKAKEQLLAKMFKATQESSNKAASSTSTRRATVQPGSSSRIRPVVASKSSTPLVAGIGAAVAVLVIGVVVLSSGRPTPEPPAPPKPAPVNPGPSAEEKRRAETAKEAVRKAREFASAHPKELEAQAQQWKVALVDVERTAYEADVRRELEKAQLLAKEAAAKAVADLEREARARAGRKEFKAALDFLGRERSRGATPTWSSDIDRLERETREAADRAFAELKEKAARGAKEEVATARAELARWGLPEFVATFEAALEVPWRKVFDGQTLKAFSSLVANAWRVENGALVHDNEVDNAAITQEDFGDGELRFRFEVKGVLFLWFRFRVSGKGSYYVEFRKEDLKALEGAEHELIFACRKDTASATLDGKPVPMKADGLPSPPGKVQFNTVGGALRIKAMDVR
jgi:hypothetical protein